MTIFSITQPPHVYELINWSLKDMAKFADAVCKRMVLNKEKFDDLVILQDGEVDFSDFSARSLGNLSYIAFYSGQTHYKNAAMKMIERYKKYVEDEKRKEKV